MNSVWAFVFNYRNMLAAAPLLYAFFSTRWEWENHWAVWTIASALCLCGALIRGWSRLHCNFARRRKKTLATTGPYALVRNPLYVGNTLVIAGAAVASGLAWFLPAVLLWAFVVYSATIHHEERRLIERYGEEYIAYRESVPTWIPRRVSSARGETSGRFGMDVSLQLLYAFLILVPFALKEIDPLQLWPE